MHCASALDMSICLTRTSYCFLRCTDPDRVVIIVLILVLVSGQIGFVLCGKDPNQSFKAPARVCTPEQESEMKLRYYNAGDS